jgi:hypothetical protein
MYSALSGEFALDTVLVQVRLHQTGNLIFFSLLLYHNVIGIRIRVSEQALNACSGP